jgi:hypothetical protein
MRLGVAFVALEIKRRLNENIKHKLINVLRAGTGKEVQKIVITIHNNKRKIITIGKGRYKDIFFMPPCDLTERIAKRGIKKPRSLRAYMLAIAKSKEIKTIPIFSNDASRFNVIDYLFIKISFWYKMKPIKRQLENE